MKRVGVFICVFAWAVSSWAANLTVDLHRVLLPDFLRVVYGELLRRSYVLDASVVADSEPITLVLRDISPVALEVEARRVLELRGYSVDVRDGVLAVKRLQQQSDDSGDVLVYRPLHRAVSYLLPLVESLFKPGSFVSRRQSVGIGFTQVSGLGVVGVPGQGYPGGPNQAASPVLSSGQSDVGLNSMTYVDQDVIVFRGSPVDVERLKKVFAQVDIPVGELLVKAVVLEVQSGEHEGSAVDLVLSVLSGKLGLKLSGGAADSGSNVFAKVSGSGLDLSAVYSAVSADQRFRVLTSPRLRVKSGASARFAVGNETPVLGSVSYDNVGRPIQSVDYRPSGVIFELRPQIRAGSSELSVTQQLSQFVTTTNGVNNSPTLIKRDLKTDVVASDGDLIVLGGLDEEKMTSTDSGLSFLPAFLRTKSSDRQKTEIVLMLQVERI